VVVRYAVTGYAPKYHSADKHDTIASHFKLTLGKFISILHFIVRELQISNNVILKFPTSIYITCVWGEINLF